MLNMITVKLGRPSTRGMGIISGWVGLFFSDLELINNQIIIIAFLHFLTTRNNMVRVK